MQAKVTNKSKDNICKRKQSAKSIHKIHSNLSKHNSFNLLTEEICFTVFAKSELRFAVKCCPLCPLSVCECVCLCVFFLRRASVYFLYFEFWLVWFFALAVFYSCDVRASERLLLCALSLFAVLFYCIWRIRDRRARACSATAPSQSVFLCVCFSVCVCVFVWRKSNIYKKL